MAIGLALIYLLMAIICSAIQEMIAGILNSRGKTLRDGLVSLLDGENGTHFAEALLRHPLIAGLGKGSRLPSYIAPPTVSLAVLDLLDANRPVHRQFVSPVIAALDHAAGGDVTRFRAELEQWYQDAMDRISGWYNRLSQIRLLLISVALTAGLNVNTVEIAKTLWKDAASRTVMVTAAEHALADDRISAELAGKGGDPSQELKDASQRTREFLEDLSALPVPMGWGGASPWSTPLRTLVGWAITAIAVSLGAQFWFDALKGLVSLRSGGNRPKGGKDFAK
ncbi:hypothetical protein [Magnetospirillum sp. 15-1]|uniref:hypothetical protein n=1 Tax=Magnetospirillum sp. 15-1 TaxID=1979370 RepID=UPI001142820F|nr:hypothetical protein [Magnetospirillum sp. 15-1]